MLLVELYDLADIDITDTIAIRHAECLISNISLNPLDSAPRKRSFPRIDDGHAPRLRVLLVHHDMMPPCKVKRNIARIKEVIVEPFLDDFLLISSTDDEVIDAIGGIFLHDMPENRHTANLYHRLRPILRFL